MLATLQAAKGEATLALLPSAMLPGAAAAAPVGGAVAPPAAEPGNACLLCGSRQHSTLGCPVQAVGRAGLTTEPQLIHERSSAEQNFFLTA